MRALSNVNKSSEIANIPIETTAGILNTTRQATDSKQIDIFFKENDFFISADIPLFLRLFLAIVNNL
jgi:hypothetical protein